MKTINHINCVLIDVSVVCLAVGFQHAEARVGGGRPAVSRPAVSRPAPRPAPKPAAKPAPKVVKETRVVERTNTVVVNQPPSQPGFFSNFLSTFTGMTAANWFTDRVLRDDEKKEEK